MFIDVIRLILDTNVVLDWLVFSDPLLLPLDSALTQQRIQLLSHAITLNELQRVLTYPELKLDQQAAATALARYRSHTTLRPLTSDELRLPQGFPECSDPDDQIFLALAYHCQATLVTRDKALLKLKRRALRFGVSIVGVGELPTQLA